MFKGAGRKICVNYYALKTLSKRTIRRSGCQNYLTQIEKQFIASGVSGFVDCSANLSKEGTINIVQLFFPPTSRVSFQLAVNR